jgi:hypothetical protein
MAPKNYSRKIRLVKPVSSFAAILILKKKEKYQRKIAEAILPSEAKVYKIHKICILFSRKLGVMESSVHIPKTELARNTRQIIRAVQRGQTAIIESHGQPEVAIVDIIDYRIMRAVLSYYNHPIEVDTASGLADEAVATASLPQERYNLILAHYLGGAISLARAAELLELSWLDLRTRCLRLDIPLRNAPADLAEAKEDIDTAMKWSSRRDV